MSPVLEEFEPFFEEAKEQGAAYVAFIIRQNKPLQVISIMPGENMDSVRRFIREEGTDIKVCATDEDLPAQLTTLLNASG